MANINESVKNTGNKTRINSPLKRSDNTSADSYVAFSTDIDWRDITSSIIPDFSEGITSQKIITFLEYLYQHGSQPQVTYSITWNGNGATSAASGGSTSVIQGNTVVLPTTNPKREYSITWNANGGSGGSGGSTKASYIFNGWWTAANGGTQVTSALVPSSNSTYYAHWASPASITLPTTNPTRDGYTFIGWAGSSTAITPNVSNTSIPIANTIYYAVWQQIQPEVTVSSISVTGQGLRSSTIYSGGTNNKTTTWTKGTVTATYSNGTTGTVTSNATISLSSSNTSIATVSGTTITAVAAGTSTITATYSYTENSVTKTIQKTATITVTAKALSSIDWVSTSTVSGTVGTTPNLGNITLTYNNGDTSTKAYNSSGVALYTNSSCTTAFSNTVAGTQNVWAKYSNKITTHSKKVILEETPVQTTYYWYVGTTKPTSLNQCEVVSEYPTEQTYTNNSGAKSHIFVLTNSDKNVTFINIASSMPVSQTAVDTTTISGYKIFETAVGTANSGSIIIRIS